MSKEQTFDQHSLSAMNGRSGAEMKAVIQLAPIFPVHTHRQAG
jgi:hypothetical protein